jgi:predicted ATP-grasp superfamily ATP-dependent carboligase
MNEVIKLGQLTDPVLIAGFVTRRKAGRVGSRAVAYLASQWGAELVARLDSEDFMDFRSERPESQYAADKRIIKWPDTLIYLARPEGAKRDFLLLIGFEPHFHWKSFTQELASYADAAGVKTLVSLRGFPASIPHTRPAPVLMNASDPELQALFGSQSRRPKYEGPTDILSAVAAAGQERAWRTVDLSALQPSYFPRMRNAAATIALTKLIDKGFETTTTVEPLLITAAEQAKTVDENLEQELRSALGDLEQRYDESLRNSEFLSPFSGQELPTGEEFINEIERILRQGKDS